VGQVEQEPTEQGSLWPSAVESLDDVMVRPNGSGGAVFRRAHGPSGRIDAHVASGEDPRHIRLHSLIDDAVLFDHPQSLFGSDT